MSAIMFTPIMDFRLRDTQAIPDVHESTCPHCGIFCYRFVPGKYKHFNIDCLFCERSFKVS